jgi:hypothetical protein
MSQVGTARQVSINREVDDRNRSHDLELADETIVSF